MEDQALPIDRCHLFIHLTPLSILQMAYQRQGGQWIRLLDRFQQLVSALPLQVPRHGHVAGGVLPEGAGGGLGARLSFPLHLVPLSKGAPRGHFQSRALQRGGSQYFGSEFFFKGLLCHELPLHRSYL